MSMTPEALREMLAAALAAGGRHGFLAPVIGAGRYLADKEIGLGQEDASEAYDYGLEQTQWLEAPMGPAGQQATDELVQALGEIYQTNPMGLKSLVESTPVQAGLSALANLDEDVLAGMDMFGASVPSMKWAGSALPLLAKVPMPSRKPVEEGLENILSSRAAPPDLDPVPDIRQPELTQRAAKSARRADGTYIGGPQAVDTPQKLGALRRRVWSLLEEGAPARTWYDESTQVFRDLTGDRPGYTSLAAGTHAATSQGSRVAGNQVFGARGYNQAVVGRDIQAGRFPETVRPFVEGMMSGDPTVAGPKIAPFYEGLTINRRPANFRPTNDIQMGRAFEYEMANDEMLWEKGFTDAQHRFMDAEIERMTRLANQQKVGGFDDWTPERVQASIWTAQKAREEGIPLEVAARNFSDKLEDITVSMRYEAVPSTELGHMPGVSGTDEYTELVNTLLQNPQGQDLLALHSGALTRPSTPGHGYWEGAFSPSTEVPLIGGPAPHSSSLDPASRDLVQALAGTRGLTGGQAMVGYTYPRRAMTGDPRNISRVDLGRPPTRGEMQNMQELLDAQFGAGNTTVVHSSNGLQVLDITDDGIPNLARGMTQVGKKFGSPQKGKHGPWRGEAPQTMTNSGDLVGDWGGYKPSAHMQAIDEANLRPEALEALEVGARQEARVWNELDALLEAEVPDVGARSDILVKAREILADQGFDGIRKAVEAGVLPVAVISAIGLIAGETSQQPGADGA